ncbi:hypothetical protein FRC12_019757 [Ceratobasidium sp. 428]|nr:hypothetical protein FRC12_019757 [Ceratobasidium sp. 428]
MTSTGVRGGDNRKRVYKFELNVYDNSDMVDPVYRLAIRLNHTLRPPRPAPNTNRRKLQNGKLYPRSGTGNLELPKVT